MPSTDYLILAALMDYSEGKENSLLGGVEIVEVRTKGEAEGAGYADIKVLEIGRNEITLSCLFDENVWCCYVAILETENLDYVRENYNTPPANYASFEECLLSLIPGLSHDFMRQFIEPQQNYRWDGLKYNTSYTICTKVMDMNGGVQLIVGESFKTNP